jgi:hypothetical protein
LSVALAITPTQTRHTFRVDRSYPKGLSSITSDLRTLNWLGNPRDHSHPQSNPFAARAHRLAGELAKFRGRTGLSRLLFKQGAARDYRSLARLIEAGRPPRTRTGAFEFDTRGNPCARLRHPGRSACWRLLWGTASRGWAAVDRSTVARRRSHPWRHKHAVAAASPYGRGIRGSVPAGTPGRCRGNRWQVAPTLTSLTRLTRRWNVRYWRTGHLASGPKRYSVRARSSPLLA